MDARDEKNALDSGALDALAVAPPPPADGDGDAAAIRRTTPEIREGLDARDSKTLRNDPSDDSSKLDIALDETFPTSDPPSNTQPGKGKDPAPSSGYDEAAEADRANSH